MSEVFSAFREPVVIESDGLRLFGVLHTPIGIESCPAILITHGYAGTKIGSRRLYVEVADALARGGIATLRLDSRGCGDSEGEFEKITVDDLIRDALHGIGFLCSDSRVDASRLGLLGGSLGGAVSILAARRHSQVCSLGLWAPLAVGQLWLDDWSRHYPDQLVEDAISCGGVVAGKLFREQFLAIDVTQELPHLSELSLLHVQGEKDRNVCSGHADVMKRERERAQGPSRFLSLPNSGHNFIHPSERRTMIEATVQHFQETLA